MTRNKEKERREHEKTLTPRQKAINKLVRIKQRINETRTHIRTIQRFGGQALEAKEVYRSLRKNHILIRGEWDIKSVEIKRQ